MIVNANSAYAKMPGTSIARNRRPATYRLFHERRDGLRLIVFGLSFSGCRINDPPHC